MVESEGNPDASAGTDDLPGCELREIVVSTECCIQWVWGLILTDMMAYVDVGDEKRTGLSSAMLVAKVAKLRGSLDLLGFDMRSQSSMHSNDLQGLKESGIEETETDETGKDGV